MSSYACRRLDAGSGTAVTKCPPRLVFEFINVPTCARSFEPFRKITLYYSGRLSKMGSPSGPVKGAERTKYCWDIFTAPALRKRELAGTPYRYWSSFAIAYFLRSEERRVGKECRS